MLYRLFRVSFLAFIAISFVLSTVAQIPTPPVVTIVGSQGGVNDGSEANPFQSSGFQLNLDIVDPNPTGYAYSGWRVISSSFRNGAQYCPGGVRPGQFFGAEGPSPQFVHPRIQGSTSARWRIVIGVNVTETPHPTVFAQTTFWVAPHPSGCTGTNPPPNPPPDDRPLATTFFANSPSARLGDTVTLTANAIDANDDTLTFFFYASSVSTPGVRGNLIATRTRGSCRDGCVQTFSLGMGNSTQWYSVEVSDGTNVAAFGTKRRVEFLSGTAPVGPSPQTCTCGNIQVQVDAGPPTAEILGGLALEIPGTVTASINGSTPVASTVNWVITDAAGLTSGLSINPVNQSNSVLSTPDVADNRIVKLRLDANGGGCVCFDTIDVTLLADPPPEADLSVTQTDSADPITVGSQVVYSVTVSNAGPDDATTVQLTDTIPSGMNFVTAVADPGSCSPSGGLVTCNLGTIPASSSTGVQFTFQAQTEGAKSNTVNASSEVPDPNFGNNSATESTTVLTTSADLSLTKTAPVDPIPQHGEFDYIIQVTNSGPDPATGVTVTDPLPEGISLVSATPTQGGCGSVSPVVCNLGSLAVDGPPVQITIRVSAPLPGQPENTATVTGAEGDPDGSNNSDSVSVVVTDSEADLTIEKVANPSPVGQGKELVYTITVVNNGPDPATAVTVTDELPDLMEFFSASASPGNCAEAAGTVTCQVGNLAVDETAVVSIVVIANADGLVENTAEVAAAQVDPDDTNNSSSVAVSVLSPNFVVVPHSLGLEGTFVAIAVLNSIGGENPLTIQGLDASGQVTSEVDLENPIAALGQEAFLTRTLIDSASAIVARGLLGPIQGFFMMGDEAPVTRLDGIGNRLEDGDRLFLPEVRQTESDTTVIFLFNPDFEAPANVTLKLFDSNGSKLGSDVTMTLEASGSLLGSVAEIFGPDMIVEDGYIFIDSDAPIRGFEVVAAEDTMISIPAQRGTITKRLVAPHFFIGSEGRTTRIRFLNLNQSPARISVTATDDVQGLLAQEPPFFDLAPNSVLEVDLAELFEIDTSELDAFNFLQGFLEFDLQGGSVFPFEQQANVIATVVYDGGPLKTLTALPIDVEGKQRALYLHVAQSRSVGMFTGLAILNQETEPVEVTVEVYDKDGNQSDSRTMTLEARTRIVNLLSDPEFFGGFFEQIGGYIKVYSPSNVVSIALFGTFESPGFLSAIGGQEPLN